MSKAGKKMSIGKNRKQISPAGSTKAARAIPSKKDAGTVRRELEGLVARNEKHNIGSWDSVKQKLIFDKAPKCSVFLGNGFNIAIGIKTSYEELGQGLLKHETTKDFLEKEGSDLGDKIDKAPGDIEKLISEGLKGNPCQSFIKDIFFEKIMKRFGTGYSKEEVMNFLSLFSKFFTTNYDPLLYLLLLKMKKGEGIDSSSSYYLKVLQIHEGKVTTQGMESFEEESVPLKEMTKNLRYELSKYIMSKEETDSRSRDNFYEILDHIEGKIKPEVDCDDGFSPPESDEEVQYMEWKEPDARKFKYKDNMFYLHGGFFLYADQGKTRKIISRGPLSFVKYLRDFPHISPLCIFEAYGPDKKREIDKNGYLRNCLRELGHVSGNLCIVGWRCNENDQHLTECINKNNRIDTLLVGYYRGDAEETVKKYTEEFPDKKIIFWDVGEAPFDINKIKEEEKSKKLEIAAGKKA